MSTELVVQPPHVTEEEEENLPIVETNEGEVEADIADIAASTKPEEENKSESKDSDIIEDTNQSPIPKEDEDEVEAVNETEKENENENENENEKTKPELVQQPSTLENVAVNTITAAVVSVYLVTCFSLCLVRNTLKASVILTDRSLYLAYKPVDMLDKKMNKRTQGKVFKDSLGAKPGNVSFVDMVYTCKLCVIAYMGIDQDYSKWPDRWKLDWMKFPEQEDPSGGIEATLLANCDLNLSLVFNKNNTQGYIAISPDFDEIGGDIVIAFRGTDSANDWFTNFKAAKTPFEPLKDADNAGKWASFQGKWWATACWKSYQDRRVHIGFYNAFLAVKETIETAIGEKIDSLLEKQDSREKHLPIRLIITGHSMGGAIAALCTAWLLEKYCIPETGCLPPNLKILSLTYGQPKVGNFAFRNWLHSVPAVAEKGGGANLYRIFSEIDPIPCLPPKSLGYSHSFTTSLLTCAPELYIGVAIKEAGKQVAQNVTKVILDMLQHQFDGQRQHDIFFYQQNLNEFAEQRTSEALQEVWDATKFWEQTQESNFLETF